MPKTHKVAFSATKILLPIDFSPLSEAGMEAVAGFAKQFHAGVHLVHIVPEIPDFNGADFFPETAVLQERKETIEQKLDACRKRLAKEGIPASFSIELGNDIVGSLMRVIDREQIDMVVISTHGMSGWHPLIFGSIAEHLVRQVNCTLLLLQSDRTFALDEPAIPTAENTFVAQAPDTGRHESTVPETASTAQSEVDRIADDLAEQVPQTEQRYDQNHSLFTK